MDVALYNRGTKTKKNTQIAYKSANMLLCYCFNRYKWIGVYKWFNRIRKWFEKKEKKTNIKMGVYIHFMQTNEIKSGVCQFGINTQQSNFIYH